MADPNQTMDAGKFANDQQSRAAVTASVALNAAQRFFLYQTTILRLWADTCELAARNCQRGLDDFSANQRRTQQS
jgi:hypothetical protein